MLESGLDADVASEAGELKPGEERLRLSAMAEMLGVRCW